MEVGDGDGETLVQVEGVVEAWRWMKTGGNVGRVEGRFWRWKSVGGLVDGAALPAPTSIRQSTIHPPPLPC